MRIGLDWDGTVSADPQVFLKVVKAFLDGGHDVAVCTWRPDPEAEGCDGWTDIEEVFAQWGFRLPIVYCNGGAKRDHYPADVWIDDNPAAVCFSLTRPPTFEPNPQGDMVVCKSAGYADVYLDWNQLRTQRRVSTSLIYTASWA